VTDRLFFAFWPDDALCRDLTGRVAEWTRESSYKAQRPDQWHLTVEFIGSVPSERQPLLHECGRALEGLLDAEQVVVLDRLEHWKKPQVLCLASSEVPPRLQEMSGRLRAELARRGFEPERQPIPSQPVPPIFWPVRALSLVRSITDAAGSRYEPFASWSLLHTSPACGRGRPQGG